MKNSATIESLKSMRFGAMAAELERQMQDPSSYAHMGFEQNIDGGNILDVYIESQKYSAGKKWIINPMRGMGG